MPKQLKSFDRNSGLLGLVEDLASAQAIPEAKSVADTITSPTHKKLALEEIEEAEESGFAFLYEEFFQLDD